MVLPFQGGEVGLISRSGDGKSGEPDAPGKPPATIAIRDDWCKGCEFCVTFCPKEVLEMKGVLAVAVRPDACTRCQICVWVCPDFAIKVT